MTDRPKPSRQSRQAKESKHTKQADPANTTKPMEATKQAKQPQQQPGEEAQQMPTAENVWAEAQKVRKLLSSQIAKLRQDEDVGNVRRYEKLAEILAHLRLLCVQTIFMDYNFAAKEAVEEALWQAHVMVNGEYRNSLYRFRAPHHAVLKRKLEAPYVRFLKLSQRFYEEYIRRLAERYGIPELEVAARRISSEPSEAEGPNGKNGKDAIKDVPAPIRLMALQSCYMTLIRLGDLVRYRLQVRHNKTPGNHLALTYYELAHDLQPTSGHAHHQMAIIYLDEKRDFDIVYHFFRSLAIELPHPRATTNLELQFKGAFAFVKSGLPKGSGPYEPLKMWFLRFHALCYRGEPFPQQGELEAEVMHRLEVAVKDPDAAAMLLKMVLINMAAYYVASSSYKENNTSFYPANVLRLNFLFFGTILNTFKIELETLKIERSEWDEAHAGHASSDKDGARPQSTPTELLILPLVRLYASWLVACRTQACEAPANVPVDQVGKLLAECLSLVAELHGGDGLSLAPHMLPEDHLAIGLLPLNDPDLEARCRLSFNQDLNAEKPLCDYYDGKLLEGWEAGLARMLDILLCGYALTEDATLPFAFHEDRLIFTFGENDEPAVQPTQVSTEQYGAQEYSQPANHSQYPATAHQPVSGYKQAPRQASQDTANIHPINVQAAGVSSGYHDSNTTASRSKTTAANTTEYDFSENTEVMNMVNDFMQPPDTHSATQGSASHLQSYEEPSYGMHSATANEVFGSVRPRSPGAFGAGSAFPALPWSMVYQPTPNARSAELAPPEKLPNPSHADSHGQDYSGAFSHMNLQDCYPGSNDRLQSLAEQYPQYGAASPDSSTTAHRARLLQAFGTPPTASRLTSQEYTAASSDGWARPFPAANGQGSQPRAVASRDQVYGGGSRPTTAQHEQLFSHETHFPNSSSLAFSQASSLFQSTPYNWDPKLDALTAFGHGPLQGTDDPTHYKNLIKNGAKQADAYAGSYDQMVLQAAGSKAATDEESQRRARR